MSTLKYRPDIDGLRAIAVLAVVLYHFDLGPLAGGFVGVDIFFVISGYLITSIIHKEVQQGSFTFAGFYERRVRRIFPAAFAMLLVTLVAGAWLLLPSDLVRLGNGTIATLLFSSNILFWRQSGYFDTSSEFNPLLHTWSLAVEEQFYIGLPVLLLLVHRRDRRWLKPVLVACAVLSFALCVWVQPLRPRVTFFLSPFRAWELLLGAILAVGAMPPLASRAWREVLSMLACSALLGSLWWTRAGVEFPGWLAAFPVLATAVLLHVGGQGGSLVHRALQCSPIVYVGLISYSLYLWHWPLLTFVRYSNAMEPLGAGPTWLLLMASLLLAAASHRWVEAPFRRPVARERSSARARVFVAAAAAIASLGLLGFAVRQDRGWRARFPDQVVSLDQEREPVIPYQGCDGVSPSTSDPSCTLGDGDSDRVALIWGDSHALAWAPALDVILKRHEIKGVLAISSSCPPLQGVHNPIKASCRRDNERVVAWLHDNHVERLFLIASWLSSADPEGRYRLEDGEGHVGNQQVFPQALVRTVELVRPLAEHIILIGPTPGAPTDVPFKVAIAELRPRVPRPRPKDVVKFKRTADWFWRVAANFQSDPQVQLIDPAAWFCGESDCRYVDTKDRLLYRDDGHLSVAGAHFVAEHFPASVLLGGSVPGTEGR